MKNLLVLSLIFSLLLSCKMKNKQLSPEPMPVLSSKDSTRALIQKFGPIIKGIWVKRDYINDLARTKSPYASRKKLDGAAAFTIEMDSVKNDSLTIGESLNNHEGTSFSLVFRKGHGATSLITRMKDYDVETNHFELGYNIRLKDTSLVLYHYNKYNHVIDSTIYTKVLNKQSDNNLGGGIQFITNKLLITGHYKAIDTTGTALNIEFENTGKVLGFLEFVKYYVNTDFVAGPENDLDQIYFDVYEKTQKQFLFKMKADTLTLYDVNKSADSIHLVWGKLRYKLVRVK